MHATDANEMTPQQRLEEMADIPGKGFLRLRPDLKAREDGAPAGGVRQGWPSWQGRQAALVKKC